MIEITSGDVYEIIYSLSRDGIHHDKLVQVYQELSKNLTIETQDLERIQQLLLGSKEYSRSLSNEIKEYLTVIEGKFTSQDMYKNLKINTRDDQKHAMVVLGRLVKEGLIERVQGRSGIYRKVDNELHIMNWIEVENAEIYMKLPLGVENYSRFYPKNVILLSGVPNSGKTAFGLETARLNVDLYDAPVRYISTEMGAGELKTRLKLYPEELIKLTDWVKTVQFIERSEDFSDIVQPNGLTIIDYVEVYDDFFKIASIINDCYKKLQEGIILILIQKKSESIFGLGGESTTWKPRLSILLDKGRITLNKVKNFRGGICPDGITRAFEIIDGWKFRAISDWSK